MLHVAHIVPHVALIPPYIVPIAIDPSLHTAGSPEFAMVYIVDQAAVQLADLAAILPDVEAVVANISNIAANVAPVLSNVSTRRIGIGGCHGAAQHQSQTGDSSETKQYASFHCFISSVSDRPRCAFCVPAVFLCGASCLWRRRVLWGVHPFRAPVIKFT